MHRPRVTQRTINCPYLGLRDDSLTSHSFPSDRNYCHYTRTPIPIEPSYQTIYCLSEYHVNCPIFTGAEAPAEAETKRGLPLLLRRGCIFTAVAAAILLISFFLPCFAGSSGMWLGGPPARQADCAASDSELTDSGSASTDRAAAPDGYSFARRL